MLLERWHASDLRVDDFRLLDAFLVELQDSAAEVTDGGRDALSTHVTHAGIDDAQRQQVTHTHTHSVCLSVCLSLSLSPLYLLNLSRMHFSCFKLSVR